jgi:hypothetical protein
MYMARMITKSSTSPSMAATIHLARRGSHRRAVHDRRHFRLLGGHSQNAALLYKNEAAIQKTSASNQWNYYQAKSNKQNLAELSITLTSGETREKYVQEVERYKKEKQEIKAEADKLEAVAKGSRPEERTRNARA